MLLRITLESQIFEQVLRVGDAAVGRLDERRVVPLARPGLRPVAGRREGGDGRKARGGGGELGSVGELVGWGSVNDTMRAPEMCMRS